MNLTLLAYHVDFSKANRRRDSERGHSCRWGLVTANPTRLVRRGGMEIYFVSLPGWFVATPWWTERH
jgi:hypothetical protein